MKRWWNTSSYPAPARTRRRRVGRVLAPAMMAGAVCLALPPRALGQCANAPVAISGAQPGPRPAACVQPPRTGGAVIQAWAFGTLSAATQPNSQEACDLSHVCALVISSPGGAGTGDGTTIKTSFESPSQGQPAPNLPFTLNETIDYPHPITKAANGANGMGACYPASGAMAITIDASSTLVLDIVGQACQVGSDTTRLVFTGSYVTDSASSGTVVNADGIGSMNINNPSGLSGTGTHPTEDTTYAKASFMGQLLYGN